MKSVAFAALLLTLTYSSRSPAQFSILIDAQKDSFYTQLERPDEGHIHIPHTDYLPLSGSRPDGEADLSADVWVGWDKQYLYLYAEVRDDSVNVNCEFRPENDCLELKFDPDPSKKAWSGIVNARLSALDSSDAKQLQGVDNLYVERHLDSAASHPSNYSRRRTSDGYALELRLAWEWITVEDRQISICEGNRFGLSVTFHDNDAETSYANDSEDRDGSIQWSAGMADEVWLVSQLLGTVEFQRDHRLKFIRMNSIDPSARPGKTYLTTKRYDDPRCRLIMIENWKYHAGDNPEWAQPDFNDWEWETVRSRMAPDRHPTEEWEGIGWFRTSIAVDSSFRDRPVPYRLVGKIGAAEIYLDGELIHRSGTVGRTADEEETQLVYEPLYIVFPDEEEHLLAVRYSNHLMDRLEKYEVEAGFDLVFVREAGRAVSDFADAVRVTSIFQVAFTVIPLLLALLHLFLYAYYPRARENLFFALAAIFWAAIAFTDFGPLFAHDVNELLLLRYIHDPSISAGLVFVLLTLYEMLLGRISRNIIFFIAVGVGVTVWLYIIPTEAAGGAIYVLIGLTTLEVIRVFIVSGSERRRERWIAAVGFVVFMLAILVQISMTLGFLPRIVFYPYGLLALSIAVSLDLARNFAKTRKNLEAQLIQVQELSAKTLEQERRAKEDEIARKILEADNDRKTRELEEARTLQLSMLPNTVPAIPYLDIAVYMKPATEVGGDYYDFHCEKGGTLTVAVGDATGHGMKAGTMVATIKGLFSASNGSLSSLHFFELCTNTIREMHLGNLYMALMLARIDRGAMTIASAGMPPVLIHRNSTQSFEKIVIKGMPLGAHAGFPYEEKETPLSPGDTILFMSDGYLELFNHEKELLGAQRVEKLFAEVAGQAPNVIIDHLNRAGEEWCNGERPHDDITFVVVKVKE